jgi:Xaa-Pro dipeptidase
VHAPRFHAAARGHVAAEAAFRAGKSEYEIHMAYVRATGHSERELPYSNIVALNTNASVLHYQHQEREAPAKHYSFLIDAGAQFHTYAADVTRTYAASDGDFAALIAGMESLQLQLCAQVRDGVDYANIHLDAHLRIANLLHDSGIITMPAADAVSSGLSGVFFPSRRRPPARPAGARRFRLQHRCEGHAQSGARRPSVPAAHTHARAGLRRDDRARPLLHRHAAGRSAQRRARQAHQLASRRRIPPYGGIRVEDNVACTADESENLTRAASRRSRESRSLDLFAFQQIADLFQQHFLPRGGAAVPPASPLPCGAALLISFTIMKIANATMMKSNSACRNTP